MQTLCVTARMGEPVAYLENGMHLDGILAWGAFLRDYRERGADAPPMTEWAIDMDLPLATWREPLPDGAEVEARLLDDEGRVWGWMASAVEAEWLGRRKMEYRKRPPVGHMIRYTDARAHHLGAGPLKAFDVAVPTLFARELRWYAVGDPIEVRALLNRVTHIGKKSTTGMGRVIEWDVQPSDVASFERCMPCNGALPRSIRAPYHHASRRVPADMREVLCP